MALPIYQLSIQNNVPQQASGAMVYVYTQPTTGIVAPTEDGYGNSTPGTWDATAAAPSLATIYFDNAGSFPMPNPFKLDGNANGWFYATSGLYTVVVTGSNLATPLILVDQALLTTSSGGTNFETNGTPNSNQALLNLVQGSNMTITAAGGNITFTPTAVPITLKVNGTNNLSQTILNLVNGTGVTVTDLGGGSIQFTSPSGLSLETNGTPNGSQSLLNLVAGTHMHLVDDGIGDVTFSSDYPAFQVNATPLTSSTTINFQAGAGITITNPSAGNVLITNNSGANTFQQTVTLSAAQILALNTTPITLVTAQGSGTIIVPIQVEYEFNEVTAAFAGTHTGDLAVYLVSSSVLVTGDSTGLLDQTVQTFESNYPTGKTFGTNAQLVNQPLVLKNTGAAYTGGGTSTLDVTVTFAVVAVV